MGRPVSVTVRPSSTVASGQSARRSATDAVMALEPDVQNGAMVAPARSPRLASVLTICGIWPHQTGKPR